MSRDSRLDAFLDGSRGDGLGDGPIQGLDEPSVAAEADFVGAFIDSFCEVVWQSEVYMLRHGRYAIACTSNIRSASIKS